MGEREHGILWVVRAERSFGQRVKGIKCCLKGGRETHWDNHGTAFSSPFPQGREERRKGQLEGKSYGITLVKHTQDIPIKVGCASAVVLGQEGDGKSVAHGAPPARKQRTRAQRPWLATTLRCDLGQTDPPFGFLFCPL